MEEEENSQDQDKFIRKIKIAVSNKSKAVDVKWKIELFRQEKKYIANFMIEFEALAMKTEANNIYAIFLLKKNIKTNIIKMILEYLPIAVLETLKKWKVVITSVEQEYEFTESQHKYKTGTETTYRERGASMDIDSGLKRS